MVAMGIFWFSFELLLAKILMMAPSPAMASYSGGHGSPSHCGVGVAIGNQEAVMSERPTGSPTVSDRSIDGLLARTMAGDRQAMATFIYHYGDRILRRLDGKLSPSARSIIDSQDILAIVLASIDQYIASGAYRVEHEEQIWSLIWTIGERAVWQQNKLAARARSRPVQPADQAVSQESMAIIERDEEVKRILGAAICGRDQDILVLWLRGFSFTEIGCMVEATPEAIWKRWERIRRRIREAEVDFEDPGARNKSRGSGVGGRESGVGSREYDARLSVAA